MVVRHINHSAVHPVIPSRLVRQRFDCGLKFGCSRVEVEIADGIFPGSVLLNLSAVLNTPAKPPPWTSLFFYQNFS